MIVPKILINSSSKGTFQATAGGSYDLITPSKERERELLLFPSFVPEFISFCINLRNKRNLIGKTNFSFYIKQYKGSDNFDKTNSMIMSDIGVQFIVGGIRFVSW